MTAYHVEAQFSAGEYAVTYNGQPTGGTLTASVGSGKQVSGGTNVTFRATPNEGYEIDKWTVNGQSVSAAGTYTLNVTGNSTVAVSFKQMMKVTASVNGQPGEITITAGGKTVTDGWVSSGTDVTFTVTPDHADDMVQVWKVGETPVDEMSDTADAPLTWTVKNVTADTNVTATLVKRPTYTITVTHEGEGAVAAEPTSVKRGGSTTITATPKDTNYYLKKWVVDGSDQAASGKTLTLREIRKDTTVKAVFDEAISYNVTLDVQGATAGTTVTAKANGSAINPQKDSPANVVGGSELVFMAKPAMENENLNKQMVAKWTVRVKGVERKDLSSIANVLTIPSLEGKTEVSVEFITYQGFNIPTDSTDQGYKIESVNRTPADTKPATQIRAGGTVEFVVKPVKAGAIVTDVVLSNPNCGTVTKTKQQDGSMKIKVENVNAHVTIQSVAVEDGIPLKITPPSNGTITVKNGDTELKSGAKVQKEAILTITATPNSNYTLDQLTVDGATKQNDGTYKVNAKATALTVAATFKASSSGGGGGGGGGAVSTYTLTFDTNGGSAIDKITKDSGTTIDLAAYKPTRAGYTFAGWFSDKALTKAVTSVKLTANTTVYAKWTESGGTAQNPFVDVKEGAYYYDAVLWAVEQKITSGTSATTFSPDASCTRAQMVTFLWRAAGSPKVENGKNPFADVKADAYYYDAVLWAVEKGVTSGTSATTFSPDATVTRGQTVTFLYRNAGSPEVSGTMPFTDVEADAYYAKAVQWAVQQKITTGTSETTFSPMSDCTRGQIVTFLYRAK